MSLFDFFGKKKEPAALNNAKDCIRAIKVLTSKLKAIKADKEPDENEIASIHKRLAEAHQQLGQVDEALRHYISLADHYGERGFYNKAVATYKRALQLDPTNTHLLDTIADFNRKVPKFMVNTQLADEMREKSSRLKNGSSDDS